MTDEEASVIYGGDFAAIEAAVLETPRGRWFLGEFARRNRVAETGVLLDAIGRLERGVSAPAQAEDRAPLEAALAAIRKAMGRAKDAVAELGPRPDAHPRGVLTAETATGDIRSATQRIAAIAKTLRETGAAAASCDELDRRTTQIYTACAFHDLTAERTRAVLDALRTIDTQLATLEGPHPGVPLEVDEPEPAHVEAVRPVLAVADEAVAVEAPTSPPAPAPTPSPRPADPTDAPATARPARRPVSLEKLLALDRLDIRERLKLFT